MCTPIAAASYAASSLGSAMNARSQVDAMKGQIALEQEAMGRRKGYLDTEYGRQAGITDKNVGTFNKSQDLFKPGVSNEMTDKSAVLRAIYDKNISGGIPLRATAPEARGIVADADTKFSDAAQGRVNNLASALSNLRSFNEVFADKGRGLNRNAQDINQQLGFMRGSRGVLGGELESAQVDPLERQLATLKAMNPLGDMLKMGGQIGMYYGLVDPAKAAAARAGNTPKGISVGNLRTDLTGADF